MSDFLVEPPKRREGPTSSLVQPDKGPPVPEAERGFLSNAPDDTWLSSAAKGTGTVLGKAVAAVPGLPGDIAGLLDYATTGAQSYIDDKPHATLLKQRADNLAQKKAEGQFQFPTSDDIYRAGADAIGAGEYKATSTPGKYLMIGGEGGASMLGPFGVTGKGVQAFKSATGAGKSVLSGIGSGMRAVAPGVAMGAGAPVAGQAAAEATGSPGMGLVAGLAAPLAPATIKGGYNLLRDPVRGARNEVIAGINDPATLAKIIAGGEDVSSYGSPRSTAQAYLNPWLAGQQNTRLNSKNATEAETHRMMELQRAQREANTRALGSVASDTADPLSVARAADATQAQLQAEVARLNRAANTATDPTEAARLQRELAVAERKLHDKEVSALYKAVDPDGVAQVPLDNLKGTAERMTKELTSKYQGEMAPELKTLLTDINSPDIKRLSQYTDGLRLDQRIEDARRQAVFSGNDGLARQLGELKTAIMSDLENVRLPPTSAAAGVDPAATLRAAKDKYIAGKDRFENPYVDKALADKGYGRFNMVPEHVAAAIFKPGDIGANTVKAWLEASGNKPESLRNIQDIALDRLNKERLGQNGRPEPITQDMLDAWKTKYGSALGEIDRVAPGFATQFDNAAQVNTLMGQFTQSQLGKFLNLSDPKEVQTRVAKMLGSDAGTREIDDLLRQVPAADRETVLDGLRRAGATGILNNFTNAQTGAVQGAALAKYLRKNEGALKALYGDNFNQLTAVADELARYERAAAVGVKRGSPTGYNTRNELGGERPQDPGILETLMTGAMVHPIAGTAGATGVAAYTTGRRMLHWLERARNQTINEIISDAIFDPAQMRALLTGNYALAGQPTSMVDSLKALGFRPEAMSKAPNVNVPARAALQGAREGESALERREQERRARGEAFGGSVRARKAGGRIGSLDHLAMAAALIRNAEKAKKGHGSTTKPLLSQPDEAITKALSIANEAI